MREFSIFHSSCCSNKSHFFHTPLYSDHWTQVFDNHLNCHWRHQNDQLLVKNAFNSPVQSPATDCQYQCNAAPDKTLV